MTNQASGNAPQMTIDSAGNVVPKPYGVSRWANPRVRKCSHDECNNSATVLRWNDGLEKAHNCCTEHERPNQ